VAHAAACGAVCLCCCLRKAVQSCCEVRRAARLAVGGADRPLFDSSWVLQLSCVALGQERDAAAASEGGLVTGRLPTTFEQRLYRVRSLRMHSVRD